MVNFGPSRRGTRESTGRAWPGMHHRRQGCTTLATILTTGSEDADAKRPQPDTEFVQLGRDPNPARSRVRQDRGLRRQRDLFVPVLAAFMTARSRDIVQRCRRAEQPLAKK